MRRSQVSDRANRCSQFDNFRVYLKPSSTFSCLGVNGLDDAYQETAECSKGVKPVCVRTKDIPEKIWYTCISDRLLKAAPSWDYLSQL